MAWRRLRGSWGDVPPNSDSAATCWGDVTPNSDSAATCWGDVPPNSDSAATCWGDVTPNSDSAATCWGDVPPNSDSAATCWGDVPPNSDSADFRKANRAVLLIVIPIFMYFLSCHSGRESTTQQQLFIVLQIPYRAMVYTQVGTLFYKCLIFNELLFYNIIYKPLKINKLPRCV